MLPLPALPLLSPLPLPALPLTPGSLAPALLRPALWLAAPALAPVAPALAGECPLLPQPETYSAPMVSQALRLRTRIMARPGKS
jgi:hypothetical protein